MDEKKLDLNLLPIFIEIYIHQSITKAGITLGLSTTAVSNTLTKLKSHFGDPLFLREGLNLAPTKIAHELFSYLQDNVDKLVRNVNSFGKINNFSQISVHCSPYISTRLLADVSNIIWQKNPDCEIIHRSNFSDTKNNIQGVRLRMNDLFFDLKPNLSRSMINTAVLDDPLCLFCSKQHPRINQLLCGDVSHETFIAFETPDEKFNPQKFHIRKTFGERLTLLKSDSCFALLSIIEDSDKVGVLPKWLYGKFSQSFDVAMIDSSNQLPSASIYMIYNKSNGMSDIAESIVSHLSPTRIAAPVALKSVN